VLPPNARQSRVAGKCMKSPSGAGSGLVGWRNFFPASFCFLISGHVADRFQSQKSFNSLRRWLCNLFCAVLAILARLCSIAAVFAVLVLLAWCGPSMDGPVAPCCRIWSTGTFRRLSRLGVQHFQAATILGPILGRPHFAFAAASCGVCVRGAAAGVAIALTLQLQHRKKSAFDPQANLSTVFEGFRYIWRRN